MTFTLSVQVKTEDPWVAVLLGSVDPIGTMELVGVWGGCRVQELSNTGLYLCKIPEKNRSNKNAISNNIRGKD